MLSGAVFRSPHAALVDLHKSASTKHDAEPIQRIDEYSEKFRDRYDAWQERYEKAAGKAEVIISKQRQGPTGTVQLHFDGATTKFSNFVADERLPSGD